MLTMGARLASHRSSSCGTCCGGCCACSAVRCLSSSSSSSGGRGRGRGATKDVPVQEKEERGSRAAAGRFTLPSSLREADDGRFDDPEEVGGAMPSRSKLRVSTVSPPLPPRRASADDELPGRGRGKSLAEPSEGEQARRRAPRDSVATGNRPAPSAPPGAGRGRGLELGAAMRRSLLPIETELAEPRAQAEDRIRLRAAGRGAQLPGSFAKFAGHEPGVSDLDEPEDSAEAILAGERKIGRAHV